MRFGRYEVRYATVADLEAVQALDLAGFGSQLTLPNPVYESWLKQYNKGFLVACRHGKVEAYGMAIRLHRGDITHNWHTDTDDGMCTNIAPHGDIVYGVSLASVSIGAGAAIFHNCHLLASWENGVDEIWFHSRLPDFRQWRQNVATGSPMRLEKALPVYIQTHQDRTQAFYESVGMTASAGILGYYPKDEESLGCAALMRFAIPRPLLPDESESGRLILL